MENTINQSPYMQGYAAAGRGAYRSSNPYPRTPMEKEGDEQTPYWQWIAGYDKACDELARFGIF